MQRFQPEQIHLAIGDNLKEMVVMWNTPDNPKLSFVQYGNSRSSLDRQAVGTRRVLNNGALILSKQYVHTVRLQNLQPNSTYWYKCGSIKGWSDVYSFVTVPEGTEWSPKVIVFGDLGLENARSAPRLQKEAESGQWNFMIHNGDIAYDLNLVLGKVGDLFMRLIEPIATLVPYMVTVGNHESFWNFSNYKTRFDMPGNEDNMMYSLKVGPALFIFLSTEVYYFLELGGISAIERQYVWLENLLIEANLPENRKKRPWIIVFGHRPMYCSNNNIRDCSWDQTLTRVGLPISRKYGLEPLLYNYGVDLAFWAHEHSYERMWPLYNKRVYKGSKESPYFNPRATIHITTGSAGNREKVDFFRKLLPRWSAVRNSDYGYTRLIIQNRTHLYFDMVSDDKDGAVIDEAWIVKEKHGPFPILFPNDAYLETSSATTQSP
ncbi:acid phosphatase type 7-like [Centruroides sculpturatus]|uniref:acid phosphatase type 7-like n=1 Tax=Centruroides sculpturatus TaxID=218467 RepID=UPI000C6EE974|nr:acid phosphatase type 7-like [Centruroides sculpturatus]